MKPAAFAAALLVVLGCGPQESMLIPEEPDIISGDVGLPYVWRPEDSWGFISWAVMGSPRHASALCLGAGFAPGTLPSAGDSVNLPLAPSLAIPLKARLASARLVRQATEAREGGDRRRACSLLLEAREMDREWSVPVYDLALLYIEEGAYEAAEELMEPVSHKYRIAGLLAWMSWRRGRVDDALSHIQVALMDPHPPPEVLLSAGIIYSVTGNRYQAGLMWRRVLSDPTADSALRLQALRYALGEAVSPGALGGLH